MSAEVGRNDERPRADANRQSNGAREANDDEFGVDDVYHLLQNQRRRGVLRCLRGADEAVEMGDVAEQVAAWEHDTTVRELTSSQRQRVYIALYQSHLPKLDEAGVVEYNQSRGHVTPTARIDRLTRYLDLHDGGRGATGATGEAPQADDTSVASVARWTSYYMSATGVSAVLLALTAFDVGVFGSLSALATGVAIVAMFALLSLGVARQQWRVGDADG